MLKRMSIKKIMVSTAAVLLLLIIYLIPDNRKEIELKNKDIEYTYNNITDTIYLIDKNDYEIVLLLEEKNQILFLMASGVLYHQILVYLI